MHKALYALGRLKAGAMNKTEVAYEREFLIPQLQAGVISWYRFEGLKFKLADNTFYTPDFAVMLQNGELELHEVKGYWLDDAKVKIKVAAEMYPMQFLAFSKQSKKQGGGWLCERFGEGVKK